jgi:hypothetical protein
MDTCSRCHIFIQDWFTQPFSPDHTLYNEIHPKRLLRVLPEIASIFIRFIKGLTFYDIEGIFVVIERILIDATVNVLFHTKDVVDDMLVRLSWTSMTDHYILKAPGEIGMIEDILKEACVCKQGEKELIGYYLTNMIINLKEVHACHVPSTPLSLPDNNYITVECRI